MSNMVVRTNVFSLNAHRNMKNVGLEQMRASNRLASGYRINTAADDAAGLAISETMRAQIRGLDQASRNSQDAQAMINATEGGLQEIQNMVQRVRELAVQAANDTNVGANRLQISQEVKQLHQEIGDMRERVEFNTIKVLNQYSGALTGEDAGAWFQVGANQEQAIRYDFAAIHGAIGVALTHVNAVTGALEAAASTPLAAGGGSGISDTLDNLDLALNAISDARANLGAVSNRLDYTMRSLDISSENLQDAESRVRNADMAREMMRFTMSNVIQQAAVSMLSQANQLPNNLLQLLR